jgi:predicted secreted protein
MPTTGVINSTAFAVYTGTTPVKIADCSDVSISVSHSPRNTNTKDSAGWETHLEGMRSWEASASGLVAYDSTNGYIALWDSINNRTPVSIRFSTEVTGDSYFSGTAYVTSIETASPATEENVTWNVSFQGTGALTKGTVS